MTTFAIRPYRSQDEQGWVRCRVLAFLDSAYFDNVLRTKERYERPAIELVAIAGCGSGGIVGLIDVELDEATGATATIWHLAVHPDWRRRGIATALLEAATEKAAELGVQCLSAWTRDDEFVRDWYRAKGFEQVEAYLHVYVDGRDELRGTIKSEMPDLKPCLVFAHYVGEDPGNVKKRFARVHECVRYEKRVETRGADRCQTLAPNTKPDVR